MYKQMLFTELSSVDQLSLLRRHNRVLWVCLRPSAMSHHCLIETDFKWVFYSLWSNVDMMFKGCYHPFIVTLCALQLKVTFTVYGSVWVLNIFQGMKWVNMTFTFTELLKVQCCIYTCTAFSFVLRANNPNVFLNHKMSILYQMYRSY